MADDLVLCTVEEGVALLTLNRPERKNAWTVAMEEEYFDLLRACERNPDVRTMVVTGAGRRSAGDLGIAEADAGLQAAYTKVLSATARPPRGGGELVTDDGDGGTWLAGFLSAQKFI